MVAKGGWPIGYHCPHDLTRRWQKVYAGLPVKLKEALPAEAASDLTLS